MLLFVSVSRRQMGDSDDHLQGQFVLGEQVNKLAFDLCILEVLAFGPFPHQSPPFRPLGAGMHRDSLSEQAEAAAVLGARTVNQHRVKVLKHP
jgi:hypothetical protein